MSLSTTTVWWGSFRKATDTFRDFTNVGQTELFINSVSMAEPDSFPTPLPDFNRPVLTGHRRSWTHSDSVGPTAVGRESRSWGRCYTKCISAPLLRKGRGKLPNGICRSLQRSELQPLR